MNAPEVRDEDPRGGLISLLLITTLIPVVVAAYVAVVVGAVAW